MPHELPETLVIPLASLIALAVEHWRLATWLAPLPAGGTAPARHAARRFEDFLRASDLETKDLTGAPFDPGIAARVVDTIDDPDLPEGQTLIAETLSPLVLWQGRVVKPADIVIRKSTKGR